MRQKVLCVHFEFHAEDSNCVISNDGYSLTIKLPNATFNIPNAIYYVEIDDGFLRYKNENKTIPGIKSDKWMIKTSESTYCKLKLLIINIGLIKKLFIFILEYNKTNDYSNSKVLLLKKFF